MSGLRLALAFPLLALAGGCVVSVPVPEPVYSPCLATGSSDWSARVARIPDHHNRPVYQPTLIVAGKVTVPGPGYSVALALGPVRALDAPVQEILVRTIAPSQGAAGAAETLAVEGRFPALKLYGGVAIRCGDGMLAVLKSVAREPDQPKAKARAGRRTRSRPARLTPQTIVRTTGTPAA